VQKRVPVICSDINVFQELFTEEEVTFFRLDDQHSLMNAIDSATKIGRQKTEKAYARYQTHYTDIIMAKGYKSLYQSIQNR
jgi:glycosyltransferase involved in cell wall biosynthesis